MPSQDIQPPSEQSRSLLRSFLSILIIEPLWLTWVPIRTILRFGTTRSIMLIFLCLFVRYLPSVIIFLVHSFWNSTSVSIAGYTFGPGLSVFWCGLIGCLPGVSTNLNATFLSIDPITVHQEVQSAGKVIDGMKSLPQSAKEITKQSLNMHNLGDNVLSMSNLPNREFLAREFHDLADRSKEVSKSVIALHNKGKHILGNIYTKYDDMVELLEEIERAKDENATTPIVVLEKAPDFRSEVLGIIRGKLAEMQEKASDTQAKTDEAFDKAVMIAGAVAIAQGEKTEEWDTFRLSQSYLDNFVPWSTHSKIEAEKLRADLALAEASRSVLEDTKAELVELVLNLEHYRGVLEAAWEEHRIEEYLGWGRDGSRLKLMELKELVRKGRLEIGMYSGS